MTSRTIGMLFGAALSVTGIAAAAQVGSTTETRRVQAPKSVTIEGCLQPEEKIPDRKPSALDKAGILEDYILTSTKVVKGSTPQSDAATRTDSTRYRVIGIKDDELKKHLGKRVQVDGEMAGLEGGTMIAKDPVGMGENLPQLKAKTIRDVAGTCTAK